MKITKSEYIIGAVDKNTMPNLEGAQFVFVGRSNVGKSSLINALCNRKNLAYTSSKPGKTQVLNFFRINDSFTFVDVPGYGYASKSVEKRIYFGKMIEEYLTNNQNLKIVFLIVDGRHKPTEDDKLMYEYLKHLNLNVKIIATKVDKIGKTLYYRTQKDIMNELSLEDMSCITLVSSENGYGLSSVLDLIEDFL